MKVNIPDKYFDLLIRYAKTAYMKYKSEISGFAPIVIKNNTLTFLEPKVLKQTCTGVNTTIDKESFNNYMIDTVVELEKQGYKPDQIAHCWWHSHHEMKAFWSGTDHACIEQYAAGGNIFALVVNNKREYKFAFANHTEIAGEEHYNLIEPELKITTNKKDLETVTSLVHSNTPSAREDQLRIQKRTSQYSWFGDEAKTLPKLASSDEDWDPSVFDEDLKEDYYDENQETLAFNQSFEPPRKPSFTPRREVKKTVAKKTKPTTNKPKRKGVRSLDSLNKKLDKLEIKTQEPVPTETIIKETQYVIENLIQDYHTGKTKLSKTEILNEVQLASEELNKLSNTAIVHIPSTLDTVNNFTDLTIKPNGSANVSNHREIQQYIQTAGSQI